MDYQEAIEAISLEGLNVDGPARRMTKFCKALRAAQAAMQELQQYKALGTLEEVRAILQSKGRLISHLYDYQLQESGNSEVFEAIGECIRAIDEYLEIEFPKTKPEILTNDHDVKIGNVIFKKGVKTYKCGSCKSFISRSCKCCPECGMAIDWSE